MKRLNLPIHIVDGNLTCPHCAGDLRIVGAVALNDSITPTFICADCKEMVGMSFAQCPEGPLHMGWVEVINKAEIDAVPLEQADLEMN